MIKKCLISGGAGFIASHVAHKLKSLGHNVLIIDDLSTGKLENIPSNCIFEKISICDIKKLNKVFSKYKPHIVFHLAALPRVQFSIKNPELTHNVNINGTFNLLLKSKEYNIERFIYSSSSSVYGDQKTLPLIEKTKINPISPYALQKLTGEYYCSLFYKIYGLKTISLRYFNVFGFPGMNLDSDYACMIPKFINLVLYSKQPVIFGDGKNTRAYTYVSDVVNANIISGFNNFKEDVFGQYFNIGSEMSYSVNDVVDKINKLAKKNIKPIYTDPVLEPKHTRADLNLSKTILGWEPKVNFNEGLLETYNYYKNKGETKWVERKKK